MLTKRNLMPSYSKRSKANLGSCHLSLQELFNEVIKHVDCTILQGHRGKEEQDHYYRLGKSKLQYPKSRHNSMPSEATDAGPYDTGRRKVPWPNEEIPKQIAKQISYMLFKDLEEYVKDQCLWYMFIGYVLGTAEQMGIKIRSGADWDMDWDILDQKFDDLPHFELVKGD